MDATSSKIEIPASRSDDASAASGRTRPAPSRGRASLHLVTAAYAAALAIAVSWVGDALRGEAFFVPWLGITEAQYRQSGGTYWALAGSVVWLAVLIWRGQAWFSRLFFVETLQLAAPGRPTHMIALLSVPNHQRLFHTADGWTLQLRPRAVDPPAQAVPLNTRSVTDLVDSLGPDAGAWNWLPLIQALHTHRNSLEQAVLLGSSTSAPFLEECRALLKALFADEALLLTASPLQPDFLDPDAVHRAVEQHIRDLRAEPAVGARRIVVNVTGGTKTASIAAAMATLSQGVEFEYVESGRTRSYRVQAQNSASGAAGGHG